MKKSMSHWIFELIIPYLLHFCKDYMIKESYPRWELISALEHFNKNLINTVDAYDWKVFDEFMSEFSL